MADSERPFLEDGSQFGISRTGFRRMRKSDKKEHMLAWFHQNFEDPAERTPYESAEGGYQWIWGGPCYAKDELWSKFGGLVPETWINEVANEIEAHGLYDWAPTPKDEDYNDVDLPDEPPSLDVFTDEPSDLYGSAQELGARARAKAAIGQLRRLLERPVGIGHNGGPPEDEDDEPDEIKELRPALGELSAELAASEPSIALVKRWATPLRTAVIASGKWVGRKLDKAVDATMATIGKSVGVAVVAAAAIHLDPTLHHAFAAVISWLEIAAKTIF